MASPAVDVNVSSLPSATIFAAFRIVVTAFSALASSTATSIFDSAAKFAPAIGVPILGAILIQAGWRWSFALTGLISLAYFVLFWRVYKDPADDPQLSAVEREHIEQTGSSSGVQPQTQEPASSLLHLLAQRKVIGLAIGFGSYNYVFYLLLAWLPSYLSDALHIDLQRSSLYTSVPWIVATITDLAVGGWLVDFLAQRGWNASTVRRLILIGGTAFGLGILGAAHARDAAHALLWISMSIGGLAAAAPVGWSLPSLIAGRNDVGKVGGIMNFSAQISGICAPILTGYLVAARHSYAWAFGVAAAYLVLGIAAYIILLGRIERFQR